MKTVPLKWVYDHLVCEFDHYDICLIGLVLDNGEYFLCDLDAATDDENTKYTLKKLDWNAECEEFLADYRKAYHHWFHEGTCRPVYDGRDLTWFHEKWKEGSPIEKQAKIKVECEE